MQYPLEQLGPTGFQDLAAALALATFGSNVQVMGSGRDGGRDMYLQGRLNWRAEEGVPEEVWEGYTVFQVKSKETISANHGDNVKWLWKEVRKELDAWANPPGDRSRLPDHIIFVTNVPLTPYPQAGGHDSIHRSIDAYIEHLRDDTRDLSPDETSYRQTKLSRLEGVNKWAFWDGNQIDGLLRVNSSVRRAFPAFLTAADVFASLEDFTDRLPVEKLKPALQTHARSTLTGEGQIYFDEAGSAQAAGFPVHQVVVDLPVSTPTPRGEKSAIRYVLDHAEHVLKPSVTRIEGPRHLILTGAPGNGKTTLTKFLVQTFRASLLEGDATLSQSQRGIVDGTKAALSRLQRSLPRNRRWAIRIDLAEYAEEHGLEEESTLLRWIARKVTMRTNVGDVSASHMQSWKTQWPWFIALDGLDEVTEPQIRKRLIRHVIEFVDEAEADNSDICVLLTTRPVGYTENIAPQHFVQIDLGELEVDKAIEYGKMVSTVRLGTDLDRLERVSRQLTHAAQDSALRPLLRTPLQVLILTIIVDGSGRLSPDRYSLFRSYYDTVYRREQDKRTSYQHLLQDNKSQVLRLHERVGYELQVQSESAEHARAVLSYRDLRDIAWNVLHEDEFDPSGRDSKLLGKLLDAAMHRLVLIVPLGEDGYGFDVRSLQELTAALFLTNGPLEGVLKRLKAAGASPHWRNVWLFAGGSYFALPQPHLHQALVELVETIDDDAPQRLGRCIPVAPGIALDIIDDGMVRGIPKWRTRLVQVALRKLHEPIPHDLPRTCRVLLRHADSSEGPRREVADGIREALAGSPAAVETATALQGLIPVLAEEISAGTPTRGLAKVKASPVANPEAGGTAEWDDLELELLTTPLSAHDAETLAGVNDVLRTWTVQDAQEREVDLVVRGLSAEPTAVIIEAALEHVLHREPLLFARLRDAITAPINRLPVRMPLS